jgi:transcription initiation factor IIE alpha subunit
MTGKEAEIEQLSNLLSIYVTLMEEVFSGRVHFKILAIMHGDKEKWSRNELAKTIGVRETIIRSALGELARANLIVYDEETTECLLKKRIAHI